MIDSHRPLPASEQPITPPRSLVRLDAARRQFGPQQVDCLIGLTMRGDPLADAVIAEARELGQPARQALEHWLATATIPAAAALPALHGFIAAMEQRPPWVEPERVERGATAYRSVGVLWSMLALGPGSLVHTYLHPASAQVLVRTGNLTAMARQRVIETGTWLIATLLPGGLAPGGPGIQHTAQVRLLHARIRATLLGRGWESPAAGLPLNQLEMTRTWLDFTIVPFKALARLGFVFTKAELDDLYHQWRYIGYLLGVDPALITPIHDQSGAQRLLDLIDGTMPPPSDDTRRLTAAMLQAIADLAEPMLGRFGPQSFGLSVALARRIHGHRLASRLGIPRSWVSAVMPLIVGANRLQRWRQRRDPLAWQQVLDAATASFQEIALRDPAPTAYQQAHGLPHADLPTVVAPEEAATA